MKQPESGWRVEISMTMTSDDVLIGLSRNPHSEQRCRLNNVTAKLVAHMTLFTAVASLICGSGQGGQAKCRTGKDRAAGWQRSRATGAGGDDGGKCCG